MYISKFINSSMPARILYYIISKDAIRRNDLFCVVNSVSSLGPISHAQIYRGHLLRRHWRRLGLDGRNLLPEDADYAGRSSRHRLRHWRDDDGRHRLRHSILEISVSASAADVCKS